MVQCSKGIVYVNCEENKAEVEVKVKVKVMVKVKSKVKVKVKVKVCQSSTWDELVHMHTACGMYMSHVCTYYA